MLWVTSASNPTGTIEPVTASDHVYRSCVQYKFVGELNLGEIKEWKEGREAMLHASRLIIIIISLACVLFSGIVREKSLFN